METLILAAKNNISDAGYNSQMLPIRGKPSLAWIVEDFYEKNNVTVVLDKNNDITQKYLKKRYPLIQQVLIDENEEIKNYNSCSILNSLLKGLTHILHNAPLVKLVLGDTLCRDCEEYNGDAIFVSSDFSSSERWCLVEKDNNEFANAFFDKIKNLDTTNKFAIVGNYQFCDIDLLTQLTIKAIKENKTQLSDVLSEYAKMHNTKIINVPVWFDLGHKAGIIKAQNHFFNSRHFNSLQCDPITGTITKISPKRQKLQDEYKWYENLPDKLKVLAPRVIEFKENVDNASLTMEMYGYPALSELFILGSLSIEEWELIIERLFQVHQLFEKFTETLEKENFIDLYLNKTWERIRLLREQNPYWEKLWQYDCLIINNCNYKNIKYFESQLNNAIQKLIENAKSTVMHGDFCFSNILFDTNSFSCKVIDPRGRLNKQTIYGDPRYDIAKLRHSVVGGYDYAVHGLYQLTEKENTFEVSDNYPHFQKNLSEYFDKMTIKYGYDTTEIKLIEALLFTSMIPLHKDNIERQKMFYLKAVKKINNIFDKDKND